MSKTTEIQAILGVKADGAFGPISRAALERVLLEDAQARTATASPGTGTSRTDWRGFVEIDDKALRDVLPLQAKALASSFVTHARTYNLHPLFLVAISKHETGEWTSNVFRNKNNAMGISDRHGAIAMPSYDASIQHMARGLASPTGYYRNCKTLADVARVYAPSCAANDPYELNGYWPKSVAKFMADFEAALKA